MQAGGKCSVLMYFGAIVAVKALSSLKESLVSTVHVQNIYICIASSCHKGVADCLLRN